MPQIRQPSIVISLATWEDHKPILKLSKQSPYTKTLGDVRYIQEYYAKGWMLKAEQRGEIVAFACIRHCLRNPYTTIYYLGVTESCRGKGVGRRLEMEIENNSPHEEIRLGIEEDNKQGQAFWIALGFVASGGITTAKSGKRIHEFRKQKTTAG